MGSTSLFKFLYIAKMGAMNSVGVYYYHYYYYNYHYYNHHYHYCYYYYHYLFSLLSEKSFFLSHIYRNRLFIPLIYKFCKT